MSCLVKCRPFGDARPYVIEEFVLDTNVVSTACLLLSLPNAHIWWRVPESIGAITEEDRPPTVWIPVTNQDMIRSVGVEPFRAAHWYGPDMSPMVADPREIIGFHSMLGTLNAILDATLPGSMLTHDMASRLVHEWMYEKVYINADEVNNLVGSQLPRLRAYRDKFGTLMWAIRGYRAFTESIGAYRVDIESMRRSSRMVVTRRHV